MSKNNKITIEQDEKPPQTEERRYRHSVKIQSDLFKASIEDAHKNLAWNEGDVKLEKVPHVHFFRTYDSDGKQLKTTNAVAGHFHEVTVEFQKEGPPKVTSVSQAKRMVKRKIKGKFVQVAELLPDFLEDTHTHDLEYIESNVVTARQGNVQAAQFIGAEAQKTQPIPGVHG